MARTVDRIVVATSTDPKDDAVEEEAVRLGVHPFRGSLEDVLGRFNGAALAVGSDVLIRLTADCPFIDPNVVDQIVTKYYELAGALGVDYVSNTLRRTYPRGLDVEVFSSAALQHASQRATQPYDREHVTPFMYNNSNVFKLFSFELHEVDYSHERWTLDTADDYNFLTAVARSLGTRFGTASFRDILAVLDGDPSLRSINSHVQQYPS